MEVADTLPYGHIQESWRHGFWYEQQMLDYIAGCYKGGSFVDVGASIGNHTVYFGKHCEPDRIYAFEPAIHSFDHMWRNVILNDLLGDNGIDGERMRLYKVAIGEKRSNGSMHLPDGGNEGMWIFKEDGEGEPVTMQPLDVFKIPDVTLIKIDAEGSELAILRGALETIEKYKPVIFVEAQTAADVDAVLELLSPIGYRAGYKFNATPTYELTCRDPS